MSEPLPRLRPLEAKQFRFCPKCGAEIERGKPEQSGFDPFTGEPQFFTPLVCPNSRRWRNRCDW